MKMPFCVITFYRRNIKTHLVEFITETIRDRGNPSASKALSQFNSTKKLHQNWMKNKNSIYLPNMQNFGILASFRPLFEIKY